MIFAVETRSVVLAVLVALTTVSVAYGCWLHFRNAPASEKRLQRLQSRPRTTIDDWYESHFASLGVDRQACVAIVGRLADDLGCDVTQILPNDAFDKELKWEGAAFLGAIDDDDELHHFSLVLAEVLPNEQVDLSRVRTVGDLVAACAPWAGRLEEYRPRS